MKVEKILQDIRSASRVRQLKDPIWKELDMFDRGEQWENSNFPQWVPKPVTNYIHLVKVIKRAAMAVENPTGKLRPMSPDDTEHIHKLQKAYESEMRRIKARSVFRDALETSRLLGQGIAHIWYDPDEIIGTKGRRMKGQIKAEQIDPASFYPDPTAFTIEDCRHITIKLRRSVEWLKKHPIYGKAMSDVEERTTTAQDRGEIYERANTSQMDSTKGIIDFYIHYRKEQTKDKGFQYSVYYLAGEKLLHKVDDLKPRMYPFAILYDFKQRQDFWGKSTSQLILENQKIINKVEQIIAMIGILLQNPQKVVHKRAGINPRELLKYGNAPGHVWVTNTDVARSIHWVQPPQIPQQLFNLAEQAKDNIRDVTGLTEAYMGQTVGSLQTSGGVNALIERSTLRDRDQMYDYELFVEDFSRILIAYMVEKYDATRFALVLGNKNDEHPEFLEYIGTDFEGLDYEFHIDVSATAPITRVRMQEEMDKLLEIQGQYGLEPAVITPEEYIKNQSFINSEQILRRMELEKAQIQTQQSLQVANMMLEAMMGQVPEEQIQEMAMQMIQQQNEQRKIGSTAGVAG